MPTTETRRLNPVMLWGIFLAIIAIGFIIVRSSTRDLVGVRIAIVDHQNIVSSVSTNGKVEPIEEFPAVATAPGVVEKVYVDVGQKVKAGQLLVKMDDADAVAKIAAANAAVHTAQATLHDIGQEARRTSASDSPVISTAPSSSSSRPQKISQHSRPSSRREPPPPAR
ncbi:biotin/lipoyl-binding protein [Tunturiibacter empetritectus]|uniref:biotin/lipoyl-binding protein n=1 Tax=Tunturiibacter empetritectus TaxID=3069691 RepID=UPI003D9B1943